MQQTVLIAGVPRGGTTLTCELLNGLDDVRALDEPLNIARDIKAVTDDDGRLGVDALVARIRRFAAEQRESLLRDGTAVTRHVDGRVLGTKIADTRDASGLRQKLADRGAVPLGVPGIDDFTLVIKQPVAFTALLGALERSFRVCAVIRNPLAVLGSWESVPLPTRDGRVGLPSVIAPELTRRLEGIGDRHDRQLELLSWFFAQIAEHLPRERVIRYEDIVSTGGAALAPIAAAATRLRVPLVHRNSAPVYDAAHLARLGPRLLERDGAMWQYYDREDVRQLMVAIR